MGIKHPFIVLEGMDFSGKTTMAAYLENYLQEEGYTVVRTREPGGCETGEMLRSLLLNPPQPIRPMTELLLFFAARLEHIYNTILPAIDAGSIVICDRFIGSSFVYQGIGRNVGITNVSDIYKTSIYNDEAHEILKESLSTFVIDIDYETALDRSALRGARNRLDVLDEETFAKQRNGYKSLDRYCELFKRNFTIISGEAPIEEVAGSILEDIIT